MDKTGYQVQMSSAETARAIAMRGNEEANPGSHRAVAVIGIRGIPANYGGLETCAEHTTRYWAERGWDVLVYCRKRHYSIRKPYLGKVRLKFTSSLPSRSMDTLSHTLWSILNVIFTERHIKLVHLYNTGNGIFLPLLKLFGKQVIMSGDGLEWKRQKWGLVARTTHKLGERMALLFADELVVDNQEVLNYYQHKYGKRLRRIAYGAKMIERDSVLSQELLSRYGLQPDKYFVFVGRLVPEKGVDKLIDAYEAINTEQPLVIIGDDTSESAYKAQLFARQSDRVRLLGFVYGDEVEQLLVNAAMYVSASMLEGTSPALLSAMGAGVCCLVNGIEENVATAGDSVCFFTKNEFEDLRTQWQSLIDDPRLRRDFAARGYGHVVEHFQWNSIAEDYMAAFDAVGQGVR